ncbi:MAG: NADP-dependent oxidoreductase [Rhodospirillaceae bacterium]|jgi:NADPH-dependent curcumin reductase|nr:NADP-dependent oxidoreductase [Rhodospirillaceae bacterium]MBT4589687.1 NADP-dependent oxidoreductase [Rhodospirillaceae bacterium]MBT4939224.1 NADP-dependent oxidoreductase [Rhodospirillaceae bacterium]MBT7267912.1 NADP-dependent oxidoreductase [Rhodospirillaceae bacterium]
MSISDTVNHQVILSSRPVGIPQAEHFELSEAPIPEPKDGEFLVRNKFLSVDPAMRGWTNAAKNYSEPVAIGDVMRAITAGEVIASKHPDYAEGDLVVGTLGWQEYGIGNGSEIRFKVPKMDVPLSAFLGILGSNGITAYFGLLTHGEPKAGETVVVSTAAGAVGSAVGQIAKIKGCRTVGLTGSDDKVEFCKSEFGYDEAINYKTADLDAALKAACPDGVDVYFDNTSGSITDTVYNNLAIGARCVVCGTASISVWDPLPTGPRVERTLLVKRARIQGLYVFDFEDQWGAAQKDLCQWFEEGKLNYREDILDGLEHAPGSIQRLYDGENQGKLLIEI